MINTGILTDKHWYMYINKPALLEVPPIISAKTEKMEVKILPREIRFQINIYFINYFLLSIVATLPI